MLCRRWFVFHLSVLDPMSSCNCLSVCLEEIREWSDAHPAHHILFIEIELKLTGDFLRVRCSGSFVVCRCRGVVAVVVKTDVAALCPLRYVVRWRLVKL